MKRRRADFTLALKEVADKGDPRVLLIEHLGFEHARKQEIDKSKWPNDMKDSVKDARFVAEKVGFRVAAVMVNDGVPSKMWRSVAARILIDYSGLAFVCVHASSGQRWLWSSPSMDHRRTAAALLQGIRHLSVEIGTDGTAPDGFISLLSRIDVSNASGDLDVLARVSGAFDTYTMDLQSDIGANVYEALRVLTDGLLSHGPNRLKRDVETLEKIRPEVFILLYRFLFILYSEARDVFPVNHPTYHDKYSLAWWKENVILHLEKDGKHSLDAFGGTGGTKLWSRCRSLFHLIMTGSVLQGHKPSEFDFRAYYGTIFDTELHMDLEKWEIPNLHVAEAMRVLSRFKDETGGTFFVDYSSLEIRHIGSIYERLLEYHLALDSSGKVIHTMDELERKSTGSYFTPDSLISRLLSNTLDPILDRVKSEVGTQAPDEFEKRVYSLRICDPAMGSGHFLVGVINHLARATLEYREAAGLAVTERDDVEIKRTIVRRCIYGVDLNGLAVELAKMSLWLDTLNSDRPLSFLDAHLKTGNSIVGAWLKSLSDPQRSIIDTDIRDHIRDEVKELITIERQEEFVAVDVQQKVRRYKTLRSTGTRYGRLMRLLDAQIVAYFGGSVDDWREARELLKNPRAFDTYVKKLGWAEAFEISRRVGFFHWELEFPEVFFQEDGRRKEDPGFDAVLGNPPWNKIKVLDKEFFRYRVPEIAQKQTAAMRERAIAKLRNEQPLIWGEYDSARKDSENLAGFLRSSGQYPLSARGDINYYPLFVERATVITSKNGYIGIITPTGLVTDYGNQELLVSLLDSGRLNRVEDFENKGLFPDVDDRFRFSLLSISMNGSSQTTRVVSCVHSPSEADDPKRWFELGVDDVAVFNPSTRTIPMFRSRRDAKINAKMYRTARSVLLEESKAAKGNPWSIRTCGMFHMTNDSHLFNTRSELEKKGWILKGNEFVKADKKKVPLFEAKMVHLWSSRYATYHDAGPDDIKKGHCRDSTDKELAKLGWEPLPRYWVAEDDVEDYWKRMKWKEPWVVVFRDITNATNERTSIVCFAPRTAYGNKLPGILTSVPVTEAALLVANLSCIPFDYCVRNKLSGTNMNFFILYQLPVLPPAAYSLVELDGKPLSEHIASLSAKLSCTSRSLSPLASALNVKSNSVTWDEDSRFVMMREIDAIFAHLYGLSREDFDYVLDTFPILRQNDMKEYGSFRTKDLALKYYDSLKERLVLR